MFVLRSRCISVLIAFAGLPLVAQQPNLPSPPHSIPEGATFLVRLEDKLDASRVRPGKHFKARLTEDLAGPDETRVLSNSLIRGHVSSVSNGLHPRLLLSFDDIETSRGNIPLIATITAVPGEHGLQVSGNEGQIERQEGSKRRPDDSRAGEESSRGPTIGSAAGVAEALFSDRRLLIQKGTMFELRLDRPIQVPSR